MRQNKQTPDKRSDKNIKRNTRKLYSTEDKIRNVLDGLRGDERIEGKPADRQTSSYLDCHRREIFRKP